MTDEILIRFINNTCSDEELEMVKDWLDESEDNSAKLFEMERIAMLAGELRDNGNARGRVLADVRSRIMAEEMRKRRGQRSKIYKWVSAAAAVAAIVVVSVFVFNFNQPRMITVETFAESIDVTLPDGSVIYLNKNSKLEYPEKFASASRDVNFSGEGFFKVAKDKDHPFVVNGEYISVTVLGTEFNFNSQNGTENNVSLVEGSVKVRSNDGTEGVVLVPGQKAEYDTSTGNITVSETNAGIDAAWHDRIIPFENANIKDIAQALSHLYGIQIRLDDVDTSKTYSGITVYCEDIDSTLSQLSNTLPITYARRNGSIVISTKDY